MLQRLLLIAATKLCIETNILVACWAGNPIASPHLLRLLALQNAAHSDFLVPPKHSRAKCCKTPAASHAEVHQRKLHSACLSLLNVFSDYVTLDGSAM